MFIPEVIVVVEGMVVVEDILLPGVMVVVEVILAPEVLVAACAAATSERMRSAVSAIFRFICFSPWNVFSKDIPLSMPKSNLSHEKQAQQSFTPFRRQSSFRKSVQVFALRVQSLAPDTVFPMAA